MKRLIITADDYGMSPAVNRAIDEGIACGLITATNVMTNMPYYKEAIKLKSTNASIGIHWVLACGKPVSPADEIPTLVAPNGEFYQYSEFRFRLHKGLISFNDVKRELIAQYNLYYELLGQPDYWNTHQNTHVDFSIYRLFVNVAKELGINKMRSHQRIYIKPKDDSAKMSIKWRLIEPFKSKLLDLWQHNAHKKGIDSPDGLLVCLNRDNINHLEWLFNNIKWKKKTIGEYVIHPACENDSEYFGKIIEQRIIEYKMFTSFSTKEIIQNAGVSLVSYNDF